jgi:hypothetical protein
LRRGVAAVIEAREPAAREAQDAMLHVEGRVNGAKKPLFDDFGVELPAEPGEGGLRLRALLERIVRAQVAAFRERQEARRFVRALSAREIEEAATRGKVACGESEVPTQAVDAERAVASALQAFEDGLYWVVLDGARISSLDAEVHPREGSKIAFLRLTLLAGG